MQNSSMRKKEKNILYLIILILLVCITFLFIREKGESTLSKKHTDFAVKDTGAITKIFMADMKGTQVVLHRRGSGWLVNGKYEANQDRIELLLDVICKLEVKNPVPLSAMDYVIRGLAAKGIKVEVYKNKKKPFKVFYVGGATQDELGTYMVLDTRKKVPYVVWVPGFNGYLSEGYFYTVEVEWRTKSIFRYDPVDISKVDVIYQNTPDQSFSLKAGENKYFKIDPLVKQKELITQVDTKKIKKFLMGFTDIQFLSVIKEMDTMRKDTLAHSAPAITIVVTDNKNVNKVLKLFLRLSDKRTLSESKPGIDASSYVATISDRPGEYFMMQTLLLEKILWKYTDFSK
jgi:hypothetical protein